jgi:adenylate cyclase class 2
MNDILKALGFHCEQTYEKWRETLVLSNTQFCLDAMPYGNFLEIEGAPKNIRQYAQELGLQWGKRILANYLEIFEILRKKLDLKFTDITFDNFKDTEVEFKNYLHLIEVGDHQG